MEESTKTVYCLVAIAILFLADCVLLSFMQNRFVCESILDSLFYEEVRVWTLF